MTQQLNLDQAYAELGRALGDVMMHMMQQQQVQDSTGTPAPRDMEPPAAPDIKQDAPQTPQSYQQAVTSKIVDWALGANKPASEAPAPDDMVKDDPYWFGPDDLRQNILDSGKPWVIPKPMEPYAKKHDIPYHIPTLRHNSETGEYEELPIPTLEEMGITGPDEAAAPARTNPVAPSEEATPPPAAWNGPPAEMSPPTMADFQRAFEAGGGQGQVDAPAPEGETEAKRAWEAKQAHRRANVARKAQGLPLLEEPEHVMQERGPTSEDPMGVSQGIDEDGDRMHQIFRNQSKQLDIRSQHDNLQSEFNEVAVNVMHRLAGDASDDFRAIRRLQSSLSVSREPIGDVYL